MPKTTETKNVVVKVQSQKKQQVQKKVVQKDSKPCDIALYMKYTGIICGKNKMIHTIPLLTFRKMLHIHIHVVMM